MSKQLLCFKTLLFVALIQITIGVVGTSAVGQDSRKQLDSYLKAVRSNFESLKTFDVFVRTDVLKHSKIEQGGVETTFERIIFDSVNDAYLYAIRGQRTRIEDGRTEPFREGFVLRDKKAKYYKSPGTAIRSMSDVVKVELFDKFRMPDVRLELFGSFGREQARLWKKESFDAYSSFAAAADSVIQSNTDEAKFQFFFANGVGYYFNFDETTLIPQETRWLRKSLHKTSVLARTKLEWELKSNIYVPVMISINRTLPEAPSDIDPKSLKDFKNRIQSFKLTQDKKLFWASVNEPIDPERISLKKLDSATEFFKLTEPLEVGVPVLDDFKQLPAEREGLDTAKSENEKNS